MSAVVGRVSQEGEALAFGDLLGHGMEPNLTVGRVCGFLKPKTGKGRTRIIYRTYANQTEKWPSGEYRVTAMPWPVRFNGTPPSQVKRFIYGEVFA